MSRNSNAEAIREALLGALSELGATVVPVAQLAATENNPSVRGILERLGQGGREVYRVGELGIVNIHVRSEPPGWWSILRTVKEDLDFLSNQLGVRTSYIFLVGRKDAHVANGYIATSFSLSPFVKPPSVEATKYTVNERQHLDQSQLLLSVRKIARTFTQSRGIKTNAL